MKCARMLILSVLIAVAACAKTAGTTAAPSTADIQKRVESYLRTLYAWDQSFLVNVGTPNDAMVPGFYEVKVEVTSGEQSETAVIYISKDGRYLLRGDLHDTSADPFARIRSQMRLDAAPAEGPADARVTVVEYSDFQCPHCRELSKILREVRPRFPQVRFVYKNFPLPQIHAWAMTAALAGRCAYQQSPEAFWKVHDAIYRSQESITPKNAWEKMLDFTAAAALDTDTFRQCISSGEAKQAIEADLAEGRTLHIANTPTVFVNGRRIVGGDRRLLEQYITYELKLPR